MTSEQIAQAVASSWAVGRLHYKLRNTQRKLKAAWQASRLFSRKFYIESTRRLGKSSALLIFFTEECLASPNIKCGFFAPVKDGLLDYIEPLIAKTYDDCPESLRPTFDKTRFMLKFSNGSSIIFRGANNKQHRIRRGQEFNRAGIDEARDVDDLAELIESVIFPSLFSTDGYLVISSTPADTRSHPLFSYREKAIAEGWFVGITIWEAQKLDPLVYTMERIMEWKAETLSAPDGQDIWEREYECKWVINKKRMAIPEWSDSFVGIPVADPYAQFYHHYIGIDWGYKDFTAIIFATWNFRKARLEVDGELTYSGTDVRSDRIAEAIKVQIRKLWGPEATVYRMVSDSADPILINELNKFEPLNFIPVPKLNSLEAMLNEFRVLVNNGKVLVNPRAVMTCHDLGTAVWNDKRTKLDQDIFAHHFDHLMGLVYLSRVLSPDVNPIPRDFLIDGVRTIELSFDKNLLDNDAKVLQEAFGARKRTGR